MTTHEYMAALKAALNVDSDYALAKALSIGQTTVSNWRIGKTTIADNYAPQIASILKISTAQVLADIHAEREKDEALRSVWRSMSAQFAKAATITAATVGAFYISFFPGTSDARALSFFDSAQTINSRSN